MRFRGLRQTRDGQPGHVRGSGQGPADEAATDAASENGRHVGDVVGGENFDAENRPGVTEKSKTPKS